MSAPQIFVDANVLIAAAASDRGGSRFLLELSADHKVDLFTVRYALEEAARNVKNKLSQDVLTTYEKLLLDGAPAIVSLGGVKLSMHRVVSALVPHKDIPILLGAFASRCPYFVTLDQVDFLKNEKLTILPLPFAMLTPGDFLQKHYRKL